MSSPVLTRSSKDCHFVYDVQVDGANMTLDVYLNTSDSGPRKLATIGRI